MTEDIRQPFPSTYQAIDKATRDSGFTMASDPLTCSLLKTLAASKPVSRFLELGTGTGLSTSWILAGMDKASSLISIDNDQQFLQIALNFLAEDERLTLVEVDGGQWIENNKHQRFDFIFADTWHGKYLLLEDALQMLNKGGFYIIDDMLPQANWPDGHAQRAVDLIEQLEKREDVIITKQCWATGVIIGVKV